MLGLAVLPLTYTVLYHPTIRIVKAQILSWFDNDHMSWREFVREGFSCFMCQGLWISIFCGIMIRASLIVILAAWGVALLIDMVLNPDVRDNSDQI